MTADDKKIYMKQWREKNAHLVRAYTKRYREENLEAVRTNVDRCRWRANGVKDFTPDDYKQRELEQGGVCAICKRPPSKSRKLAVDHHHGTGLARGLLCARCNTDIAVLESPLLEAYLKYLVKWSGPYKCLTSEK